MKSKCIVFNAPHQVKLGEIDLPAPGSGQVITRTLYTGVSTGTESRVLRGGEVDTFPLIPGYENVGEIIQTGPEVDLKIGDKFYVGSSDYTGNYGRCWGAHVEFALVNATNLLPVPEGVAPIDALYAKVGGIALHGILRAKVTEADTVAVVGLGLIGHLAAQCARAYGAKVIAIDMDPERLDVARKAGFQHVLNAKEGNLEERVKALSNGGVDVAVEVTGIAHVVDQTAQLVHGKPWAPPYPPSARVVLLGSYTEPVTFSYHPTLFGNEPDILPSRDSTRADWTEILQLIAARKVVPGILPTKLFSVEEAPQAYHQLTSKKLMRIVFKW